MFDRIVLHGGKGEVLWGYRPAAVLTSWRITKDDKRRWSLTADVSRLDAFQCRQTPLLFTAPRDKGMWCWEIQELSTVGPNQIRATLGQPLQ